MTLDYEVYKEGGLLKDRYHKIEDISEGSYGYVSLAKDSKLKKLVAVKFIFKTEDDFSNGNIFDGSNNSSLEKHRLLLKRQLSMISSRVRSRLSKNVCFEALYEVDIHNRIGKHKNIAELLDYFDSYIIMEYCSGGDLYEAIKADLVPRKTKQLTHIISQIMDAVEFVHNKGIYHRDIKPENILIADSNWTIKLTDWGLATTNRTSMDRNVGSERYMAPELFESNLDYDERGESYDCSKVDIWAIGIVLLNIVFYKNPFSVANQSDKAFCYFAANREALFDVFSTMSYDFFQLLRHSLTIDPTNRYLASMKEELCRLHEYTLDDEYHNSLNENEVGSDEDDGYSTVSRFQEIDSSNTTTPFSETDSIIVPNSASSAIPITVSQITLNSKKEGKEGKQSVPRFTFTKKSTPKSTTYLEKNTKPIKIKHDRKIIKNTRKPLGIPSPNSHINNFFHDYKNYNEHENFNTRNFYTPPSVHNRYMEGVFCKKNKHQRNNHHYHSNNYNSNSSCRPNSASAISARSLFQGAGSYGNNNGINSGNNNSSFSIRHGNLSINGHNSPSGGKYIPPHSRNSFSNFSPNNQIMTNPFDSDSLKVGTAFHEQHRLGIDTEHDVDDVLFTLEESDVDNNFLNNMSNLSIQAQSSMIRSRAPGSLETVGGIHNHHNNGVSHTYVPDLLKSPQAQLAPNELHNHLKNFNFSVANGARRQSITTEYKSTEYRPKPGVYIPPHHRKSFNLASSNNINSSVCNVGPTLSVNTEKYNVNVANTKKA